MGTTHYNLPIFSDTSKPKWLIDWNNTMSSLDDIMTNLQSEIDSNTNANNNQADQINTLNALVIALQNQVNELSQKLETDINTLQTNINGQIAQQNTTINNFNTSLNTKINKVSNTIPTFKKLGDEITLTISQNNTNTIPYDGWLRISGKGRGGGLPSTGLFNMGIKINSQYVYKEQVYLQDSAQTNEFYTFVNKNDILEFEGQLLYTVSLIPFIEED